MKTIMFLKYVRNSTESQKISSQKLSLRLGKYEVLGKRLCKNTRISIDLCKLT